MFKITEFTDYILSIVSDELDVSKEQIKSKSRISEITDARHLAVMLLHCHNVYPSRIASVFGVSDRSIRYIISTFDTRIKTNNRLCETYAKLRKQLGCNSEYIRK